MIIAVIILLSAVALFFASFLSWMVLQLASMVQHAIWFRPRIVGHVIESVAYAAIIATIFASLWPAS